MAVEDSGSDLSEDPPGLELLQALALAQVVIQLSARRDLHHEHHLLLVLEHCITEDGLGLISIFTNGYSALS